MDLPFTPQDFFAVFERYNTTIWPLQLVFIAAALLALAAILARRPAAPRWTIALLAVLWLWMGVVYHGIFFRPINPAASFFAALFIVQAALLAWTARSPGELIASMDWRGLSGAALIVYSLAVYPLLGHIAGHSYPASPTFGLPCPTTLFTLGVLLWLRPIRPSLMVVPILWSVIGFTAAFRLGVYEDAALAVAAAVGVAVILVHLAASRRPTVAG